MNYAFLKMYFEELDSVSYYRLRKWIPRFNKNISEILLEWEKNNNDLSLVEKYIKILKNMKKFNKNLFRKVKFEIYINIVFFKLYVNNNIWDRFVSAKNYRNLVTLKSFVENYNKFFSKIEEKHLEEYIDFLESYLELKKQLLRFLESE